MPENNNYYFPAVLPAVQAVIVLPLSDKWNVRDRICGDARPPRRVAVSGRGGRL